MVTVEYGILIYLAKLYASLLKKVWKARWVNLLMKASLNCRKQYKK